LQQPRTSELWEVGLKGSFLDDSLYFAVNYYEQERTDFSAQSIVTNSSSRTEGIEAELRWVVNEALVVTAGWTNMEVFIVEAEENGGLFSFFGADDIRRSTRPWSSAVRSSVFPTSADGRKAGIPENIYTLTGTYSFNDNLAISGNLIQVDETCPDASGAVILPSYTLLNARCGIRDGVLGLPGQCQEHDGRALLPLELPEPVRQPGRTPGTAAQLPGPGGLQVLSVLIGGLPDHS
jgi:iron complex outermembrane receptor protein